VVAEGRPEEVITNTAAEKNAGLIVVGSHGRSGIARILLGSVSERVIGAATCPVLVETQG
jgi:nucleotide-binding universal stress UspA family protein